MLRKRSIKEGSDYIVPILSYYVAIVVVVYLATGPCGVPKS